MEWGKIVVDTNICRFFLWVKTPEYEIIILNVVSHNPLTLSKLMRHFEIEKIFFPRILSGCWQIRINKGQSYLYNNPTEITLINSVARPTKIAF